ncbi:early nodulin-like protein 1-like [Trifolium pratense]|uniref:Early nodulin-like protein 1-like n=2 Tax=Trifolium pratense TaxID=57577 RepID=A0A2K3L6R8_TRIPR|nr:early nodulin-like protein 1-like [Trifolium pratense]
MASMFKAVSHPLFLILILFSASQFLVINGAQFEVGGKVGWVVPNSKDKDEMYNQWASQNRFKIDDTIHFKYEKDSVMVVSEEEYEKCKSARPLFFGNNGDTVFKFERPGLFYFISGVSGHCTRGQKMIIKVLDIEPEEQEPTAPSPQSSNENAPTIHSKAAQITPITITISTLFALLSF